MTKQRFKVDLEVNLEVDVRAWAEEYGLNEREAVDDAQDYMRTYLLDALNDSYAVRSELVRKVEIA